MTIIFKDEIVWCKLYTISSKMKILSTEITQTNGSLLSREIRQYTDGLLKSQVRKLFGVTVEPSLAA